MTYTTRGQRQLAPGDLTGRRAQQLRLAKDDRWKAIKETINHPNEGGAAVLVQADNGTTYAVPKAAMEALGMVQ
jgi:hypothetical protein